MHEAAEGFKAGHKVASLMPCVVVLDLRLPGVDGYKVCETIRTNDQLKQTRILAVTGRDAEESQ
jgi:CheY-like chemotaxis protein